jgi:hypothetical protein
VSRVIEYGQVKYGPNPPSEYGNPVAIPVSVARRLIEDFDDAARGIPFTIDDDRVVLMRGPQLHPTDPVQPYGWYVAFEYVGRHRKAVIG